MSIEQPVPPTAFSPLRAMAALEVCRERRHELMASVRHLRTVQIEVCEFMQMFVEEETAGRSVAPARRLQAQRLASSSWRLERRFQGLAEDHLRCCADLDAQVSRMDKAFELSDAAKHALQAARESLSANLSEVTARVRLSPEVREAVFKRVSSGEVVRELDVLVSQASFDLVQAAYGDAIKNRQTPPQKALDTLAWEIVQIHRVCDLLLLTQRT